jgi:hypothetical protein
LETYVQKSEEKKLTSNVGKNFTQVFRHEKIQHYPYGKEKYKWDGQLLKPTQTRYYSINTHLLTVMLMLHVLTFL